MKRLAVLLWLGSPLEYFESHGRFTWVTQ